MKIEIDEILERWRQQKGGNEISRSRLLVQQAIPSALLHVSHEHDYLTEIAGFSLVTPVYLRETMSQEGGKICSGQFSHILIVGQMEVFEYVICYQLTYHENGVVRNRRFNHFSSLLRLLEE